MKTRVTIYGENDKHNDALTNEDLKRSWQAILDYILLIGRDPSEKCIVEKAEILES